MITNDTPQPSDSTEANKAAGGDCPRTPCSPSSLTPATDQIFKFIEFANDPDTDREHSKAAMEAARNEVEAMERRVQKALDKMAYLAKRWDESAAKEYIPIIEKGSGDEQKWRDYFVLPIANEMKRRGIGELRIKLTEKGTAVFELLPENAGAVTRGANAPPSPAKEQL